MDTGRIEKLRKRLRSMLGEAEIGNLLCTHDLAADVWIAMGMR